MQIADLLKVRANIAFRTYYQTPFGANEVEAGTTR
jgi:hypothetical protein